MAAAAPMRSADVHLQNVLAGTARSIYDDSYKTPFAHYSGHTVAMPGGGFRVHPMQISIPSTPRRPPQADPSDAGKWWASRPAAATAGAYDPDAMNALALSVQRRRPGGASVEINRNSLGQVTGYTMSGAMPTQAASNLAVARLKPDFSGPCGPISRLFHIELSSFCVPKTLKCRQNTYALKLIRF
jgi:hypothetical protein